MVGVRQSAQIAGLAALLLLGARPGSAQVVRPHAVPVRAAAIGDDDDAMTITLTGAAINFNFISGSASNAGSGSITMTTRYTCPCDTATFEVYAYFNSATAALTDGAGDNIPSSAFSISDNGGAFRALNATQPLGGANAGLNLVSIPGSFANRGTGSHVDVLNFNVNLSTGTLPNLPPGTYVGTLTIQAQAD
jgi:hypothetical protein